MNRTFFNFMKTNQSTGMMAISVLLLILLGCTCGRTSERFGTSTDENTETTSESKTQPSTDAPLPSNTEVERLIKATALDFADAIDRSDFSDMYEKASSDFQRSYSEEQMKDAFSGFMNRKRHVVPILNRAANMTPRFDGEPYLRKQPEGTVLVVKSKHATRPAPVEYDLEYVFRENEWKLLKLIVKVGT
jgi:hypothetical protein